MADEQDKPGKSRRRFQFSLRAMMLFVVVASLLLAWMGNQARKHRQVAAEVDRVRAEMRRLGGSVSLLFNISSYYGPEGLPYSTTWLETLFGDPGVAYFAVAVHSEFDDDDIVPLQGLTNKEFAAIRALGLKGTQVTDAGLVHLQGFTDLQMLNLSETKVTDAGLVHLRGLKYLKYLNVELTQVTDAWVKELRQALSNCSIFRSAR